MEMRELRKPMIQKVQTGLAKNFKKSRDRIETVEP